MFLNATQLSRLRCDRLIGDTSKYVTQELLRLHVEGFKINKFKGGVVGRISRILVIDFVCPRGTSRVIIFHS